MALENSIDGSIGWRLLREQAERARANAEIAANEARQLETLGRLSAGIAHDFNNSLTAIIGCAEVLRGSLPTSMTTRELAGAIIESSERAAALTRELLAYSRKAQMVLKPVDLHPLITGALTLLRASLSSDIRIELRLSANHSVTRADATSLQHAIVNLLVNARDAMPGGGCLTISTREHLVREARDSFDQPLTNGPYLLLEVRDTGTGIDPVNLPKIFEPFFTTKAVGQGTGLGLAAVAGTVRSLGGAIGVETEPGAGTVFRILLPLEDAPVIETEQPAALKITQGRGHILLIDDDAAVRNTAEATMTMFGYQVTAVDNGERAIERVRAARQGFDLVLLDLRMPNLSGPETFDRIHTLAPSLPILIWSGYGLEHDVQTLIERGAAGFIQKPYSISELSQALSLHIAKPPAAAKRSVEHAPTS